MDGDVKRDTQTRTERPSNTKEIYDTAVIFGDL